MLWVCLRRRQSFVRICRLRLFGLLHLSQLVNQFLDQSYVETLSQQLQYLAEHMQERRSELFELQLQTDQHWSKDMLQFVIVLDQILWMLLLRKQLTKTFIGCFPDSFVDSTDQLKHCEDDLETGFYQFVFVTLSTEHCLAGIVDAFVEENGLQEAEDRADETSPILDFDIEVLNVEAIFLVVDKGISIDAERLVICWLGRGLTWLRSFSLPGLLSAACIGRVRLPRTRSRLGTRLLLLNNDLGKILIDLIVDADNLLSNCDDLLESLIETDRLIPIFRNLQHLEGLVHFSIVLQRNQQFQGGKAIMQHFQKRRVAFQ